MTTQPRSALDQVRTRRAPRAARVLALAALCMLCGAAVGYRWDGRLASQLGERERREAMHAAEGDRLKSLAAEEYRRISGGVEALGEALRRSKDCREFILGALLRLQGQIDEERAK